MAQQPTSLCLAALLLLLLAAAVSALPAQQQPPPDVVAAAEAAEAALAALPPPEDSAGLLAQLLGPRAAADFFRVSYGADLTVARGALAGSARLRALATAARNVSALLAANDARRGAVVVRCYPCWPFCTSFLARWLGRCFVRCARVTVALLCRPACQPLVKPLLYFVPSPLLPRSEPPDRHITLPSLRARRSRTRAAAKPHCPLERRRTTWSRSTLLRARACWCCWSGSTPAPRQPPSSPCSTSHAMSATCSSRGRRRTSTRRLGPPGVPCSPTLTHVR